MRKWIGYLSFGAILVLVLSFFTPIRAAIQQIAGLAVAQSSTKWNNVKDAAVGDNLTSGILVGGLYLFDGTNWDRVRGDTTYGLDVDVTRMPAIVGSKTPADAYANPTDHLGAWSLLGLFNGTTWDRARGDITNGLDVDVTRLPYVAADNSTNATTKLPVLTGRANDASPAWTEGYQVPLSSTLDGRLRTASTYSRDLTLLASGARTANGDSGALSFTYGRYKTIIIQLNVTAASGTTPTLDVYIDITTDGTNWINMAHFAQFTGSTGRRAIQISSETAGSATDFDATADLAAGAVRQGPWGYNMRVRWIITGTTPSYTFDITGSFKS